MRPPQPNPRNPSAFSASGGKRGGGGGRLLRSKLLLVALLAGTAAVATRLAAGPASVDAPPPNPSDPLGVAAAAFHEQLTVRLGSAPDHVEVVYATATAGRSGRAVEVWATVPPATGLPADLYVFSAEIAPGGIPIAQAVPEPVLPTAAASERLLAAGLGRALVAVGAPTHLLSLRDRAGGRLDLQLDPPATTVGAVDLTPTGFSAVLDDALVVAEPGVPTTRGVLVGVPPLAVVAEAPGAPMPDVLLPPAAPATLGLPPGPVDGIAAWTPVRAGLWQGVRSDGIQLFVMDSRVLQLRWSAGLQAPITATGLGGRGRSALEAEAVAWFDGPALGAGAAEEGRQIAPPVPMAASVLVEDARTLVGLWDRAAPPTDDLAQTPLALVLDGEVLTRQRSEPQDHLRLPRSALGATADGALVFAWAPSVTATALGDALRQAGVQFALPLGVGSSARGMAWQGAADRTTGAGMSAPGAWETPRLDSAFLLVPRHNSALGGDPRWQPVPGPGPLRMLTRTAGPVRLALLDSQATRLRVRPGSAEPWSAAGAPPPATAPDPTALAHLIVGVRGIRAPFGLVVDGTTWRAPRPQAFTLALDDEGHAHFGRHGQDIEADRPWAALVQGPALIENERRVVEPVVRDGLPVAALGRRADGHLVFGTVADGDVEALTAALEAEGVVDALRLADRGCQDGGRVRLADGKDAHTGLALAAAPVATLLEVLPSQPPPSVEVLPAIR